MSVFHYFEQLPVELRLLIWKHCLPHRIAEEYTPDFLLDGNESRQACWAKLITHQNAQLLIIAFVSSESRQVALEQAFTSSLFQTARGSMETTSRMDHPRVHVADGTRGKPRPYWDKPGLA